MKYFKLTLLLFIICLIASSLRIEAGTLGVSIKLNAHNLYTKLKDSSGNIIYRTKTNDISSQKYTNYDSVKLNSSGEKVSIMVRTVKKSTEAKSGWETIAVNQTKEFGESTSIYNGEYTLEFKQLGFTLYFVRHGGLWTY
jgi:hypothetical protein